MPPPAPTDDDLHELIKLLRRSSGTQDAASVLAVMAQLRDHAHRSLSAKSPLRRLMDSEDLMMDTVLDLIAAADEFRGSTWAEFFAFAAAVQQRRAQNQGRRARVRRAELQPAADAASDSLPGDEPTPSVNAAALENRTRLLRLIDNLPAEHRRILRLKLEGLDNIAIADRLGIRPDAARQRLSRALAMLRAQW